MKDKHEWLVELPDGETTTTQYITDEELEDFVFQISPPTDTAQHSVESEEIE